MTSDNEKSTGFESYGENNYGKVPRITDDAYRERLTSWQVPAIKKHIGDLKGQVFIDIGAGDIVLGEKMPELGIPHKYYVQDLSRPSLTAGIRRIKNAGFDVDNIIPLVSDNFDFDDLTDGEIDCAFSNSLFSHLTINSIVLCLRKLSVKMRSDAKYFSSMIILPEDKELETYDWSYLNKPGTNVLSSAVRDPYHYTEKSVKMLSSYDTGLEVKKIHDYGHPFQKLVEFARSS